MKKKNRNSKSTINEIHEATIEHFQVNMAEMREVKDSKTAMIIFDNLEMANSEESLLKLKVQILILAELERIRFAAEDPFHVKYQLEQDKKLEEKSEEAKS